MAFGFISNVVEDTTPQLGGNLDLNSKNITGSGTTITNDGHINVTGVVTVTTFGGDRLLLGIKLGGLMLDLSR